MELGFTIFIIAVVIIIIWLVIEMKRFRHKMFAIFLIVLILFTYISFTIVLKEQNINLKTIPGIMEASKLYFSWLGHLFVNLKTITINVIKLDWVGNSSSTR